MEDIIIKEKLRIIYEDLNNKISTLQLRINQLESKINQTNTVTIDNQSSDKVYKNMNNLKELLRVIPDQSFNFANNIINNKYPTMTIKQFDALDKLAKQYNFFKPLTQ